MLEGAFAPRFNAWAPLLVALAWTIAVDLAAYLVLRRALGADEPAPIITPIPQVGIN